MDDHAIHERNDSEVDPGRIDSQNWLDAASDVWEAWLFAVAAVVVAVYFHLTEGIWQTAAEIFYAEIFALAAVIAIGYGVYQVHERTSPI